MTRLLAFALWGSLALAALVPPAAAQPAPSYPIVPLPRQVDAREGTFVLDSTTAIAASSPQALQEAEAWAARVRQASGLPLPVAVGGSAPITFTLDPAAATGDEGYTLDVMPGAITVTASTAAGLFYGAQTLRQLLPPAADRGGVNPAGAGFAWTVPAVRIEDAPRFRWRGLHLDVSRHFSSVAFVKRYIDLMALYKLNRFHWHLTDDQGWRIEIKKYPRLTEVGAWRDGTLVGHYRNKPQVFDSVRYGGYYTQDEIREVVAYAAARHVTVVPEIEMPGHASAAIAAYPELGCRATPPPVVQTWGVFEDIFCPKEETFAFLENVLEEVISLFPGPYVHVGGDEAPKKAWEESALAQEVMQREGLADEHALQSYFIRRIERFLNAHDRRLIGWDEIVEGGLSPTATLMFWRDWNKEALAMAARQGNDLIMTPTGALYFDYFQADPATEPLGIGGMNTMEEVYAFEPVPASYSDEEARHVLGAQANLWREYIETDSHVEYMMYPRTLALAEVVWTARDRRDWADFQRRLPAQLRRLNVLGVHYRPPLEQME